MNRRNFLFTSSAAAALTAIPSFARPSRAAIRETAQAKNLIFMVADGMSTGTLSLADLYLRRHEGKPSNWVSLWNKPGVRRATATTSSADSLVTDSAAGGCAWGIGIHINNGAINVTPQGRQVMPLLVQARQNGKMTGLVTTARVTHATPASFIANVPTRDMEKQIAQQIMARGVDVALGGGSNYFPKALLDQHPDAAVVRTRDELLKAPAGGRLLGIFDPEHVPYVLDRGATVPSLVEMTTAALGRLSGGEKGFVLQIEGGRVDHGAHDNDAGALISEQVEFDRAIGAVCDFVKDRDDTLVIITTDHANANPGLTLYAKKGNQAFDRIKGVKRSFDWVKAEFTKEKKNLTPDKIAEIVEAATGIGLDTSERTIVAGVIARHRVSPFATANKWTSVLGAVLADHLGVAFVSPNHTADMVEVTALGPGSQRLQPFIDNVDLHGIAVGALGLADATPLPGTEEVLKVPAPVDDD